jgi:prepilin-type N-terminal cleavage/methylation domain-containing protein
MHRSPSRGFTLLELTVVLTIVGLLLALVLPGFGSLRNTWAVRTAMTDIASAFSLARQTALSRRAAVAVVFDTSAGVVQVRSIGGTIRREVLGATYGVSIGANRDSAVYDPHGLGYGVSNLTVTVRRGTFVDTLTMSRMGRIRW